MKILTINNNTNLIKKENNQTAVICKKRSKGGGRKCKPIDNSNINEIDEQIIEK